MEDGIAGKAELAQDFSHGAHNFGQALGPDDDQRDCENQGYFKKIRQSLMITNTCYSTTLRGAEKFLASAPCQLIIIPDSGVNDA
jgi:hypothetical protein